jgi:transcription antitermination factor NusB
MDELRQSDFQYEQRLCTELTQTEQRSLIFHLLYVLYAYDYEIPLESVADSFKTGFGIEIPSTSDVFSATQSIVSQRSELDSAMIPLLENWRFDRLGVATTLILRLALWELQQGNIEPAIIINEAVELAKCFAEKDAYKFINGILDNYLKSTQAQ